MTDSSIALTTLLALALKATILLTLAALLDRAILRRHASAAARHLLWSVTIIALLLLPVAGWIVPTLHVPLPAIASLKPDPITEIAPALVRIASPEVRTIEVARGELGAVTRTPDPRPMATSPATISASESSISWTDVVLGIYLAGVIVLLIRVAAEQRLVRRIERGATPVRDAEWTAMLRTVAERLNVRRPVAILHGAASTMPLTWGVRRPAVLIPAGTEAWPQSRRQAVLLHELAHVTRLDCLTQLLAAITCAIYWPHPGIWWAAARLRIERELACDDQALLAGMGAHDYAFHLLEIARLHHVPSGLNALAVSMAARSHLETRLRAVIDVARRRAAPSGALRAGGAVAAIALVLPLAALRGTATAAAAPIVGVATAHEGVASVIGAAAVAPTAAPAATAVSAAFEGDWVLRLASDEEARREAGGRAAVHVRLMDPGLNTFVEPLSALDGLSTAQISSSAADARFTLRRDAGIFAFTGEFAGGKGRGHFVFTPDPAFADSLARRGMERPTDAQLFKLARHGVGFRYLDVLSKHGYRQPTTSTFVRASLSGADERYVAAMAAEGYRFGTVETLISVYNQGVTPEFVRELAAQGYKGLTPSALMRLRNSSVVPPASAPSSAVVAPPREPRVVSSATPLEGRWVLLPSRAPFVSLELQWIDDTQWRRAISVSEFAGVSADQIASPASVPVSFRIEQDAGRFELDGMVGGGRGTGNMRFVPNRDFIAVLRSLGIREIGDVSDHTLKNLAWGGMSAEAIRGFIALGFTSLTLGEVTDLAIRTVTPGYVRALRDAGVTDLNTPAEVIDLYFGGMPPEYARQLGDLGYRGLSGRQVLTLYRAGVTPAFIRDARASSGRATSVEELLDLAREAKKRDRKH
jgi:beta-lactamase regulating signal transducer with metallopeptidase domain